MQVNKVFFGALYMFDLPQENSREAGQVIVVPHTWDAFTIEKKIQNSLKNLTPTTKL